MKKLLSNTILCTIFASTFFIVNCQKAPGRKVKATTTPDAAAAAAAKMAMCSDAAIAALSARAAVVAEIRALIAVKATLDASQKELLRRKTAEDLKGKTDIVFAEIRKLKVGTAPADGCKAMAPGSASGDASRRSGDATRATYEYKIIWLTVENENIAKEVKAILDVATDAGLDPMIRPPVASSNDYTRPASDDSTVSSNDGTIVLSGDLTRRQPVASQDTTVVSRDNSVVISQDTTVASQDVTVVSRDTTVASQDVTPASQDVTVVSHDTTVVSQDVTPASQDVTVSGDVTVRSADITRASSADQTVVRAADNTRIIQGQTLEVATPLFGQMLDKDTHGNEKILISGGRILSSRDRSEDVEKMETDKAASYCKISVFEAKLEPGAQLVITSISEGLDVEEKGAIATVTLTKNDKAYGLECFTLKDKDVELEMRGALGAQVKVIKNAAD